MTDLIPELQAIYDRQLGLRSDIHQHLPTLRHYAAQCQHVTEFGIRDIVSTWGLMAGVPERLVSYDIRTPPNLSHAERIAAAQGIDFQFVEADVLTVDIEPTDMLFTDTIHTYDHLIQEFDHHAESIRRFILIHDTTTFGEQGKNALLGGEWKGLWYAVEEFLASTHDWQLIKRYTNNNGLTVLGRTHE